MRVFNNTLISALQSPRSLHSKNPFLYIIHPAISSMISSSTSSRILSMESTLVNPRRRLCLCQDNSRSTRHVNRVALGIGVSHTNNTSHSHNNLSNNSNRPNKIPINKGIQPQVQVDFDFKVRLSSDPLE